MKYCIDISEDLTSKQTPGKYGWITEIIVNRFLRPILNEVVGEGATIYLTDPGQKGFARKVKELPDCVVDVGTGKFKGHVEGTHMAEVQTRDLPITTFVKVSLQNKRLMGALQSFGFSPLKYQHHKGGWVDLTLSEELIEKLGDNLNGKALPKTYGMSDQEITMNAEWSNLNC